MELLSKIAKKSKPEIYVDLCACAPENTLADKNIVIVGGTSGIGLATAKKCYSCGANVLLTGRDTEESHNPEKIAKEIGSGVVGITWDIHKTNNLDARFCELESEFKTNNIDCIFVNAGIYIQNSTSYSDTDYLSVMETNLRAPFNIILALVNRWLENEQQGIILATGSNRGFYGDINPYALSKAALHTFIQGIARKYGYYGIRANAIAPGMTATAINNIDPDGDLATEDMNLRRIIRPEEIAEVASFLLSDRSSCINGVVIPCDLGDCIR